MTSTEWHYFLSDEVMHIFEENNVTGLKYLNWVKDDKQRDMASFHLFTCLNILPPTSNLPF